MSASAAKQKEHHHGIAISDADKKKYDTLKAEELKLLNQLEGVRRQIAASPVTQKQLGGVIEAWAKKLVKQTAEDKDGSVERPPADLYDRIMRHVTDLKWQKAWISDIGTYEVRSYLYDGKFVAYRQALSGGSMDDDHLELIRERPDEYGEPCHGKRYSDLPERQWPALRCYHTNNGQNMLKMYIKFIHSNALANL